jgi:hypothetical protein
MTPIATHIEVYGDKLVEENLISVGERAVSMEPLWAEIVKRLETIEKEQFETSGGRSGHRWPELEQSTLWRKFRQGQNLAILRASDEMYQSLVGDTESSVRFMSADSLEFGSTTEQFGIQQDWRPGNTFPERLSIDLTVSDEVMFSRMMLAYIVGEIDSRGQLHFRDPSSGRFIPYR